MSLKRGWCPTAWRPMAAGDGLLVRVRPPLGRMDARQVAALAEAARVWGNGSLDLTSRAAIQVRGISKDSYADIRDALIDAGLVDPDPEGDARPPILVEPCWRAGDDTHRIALALAARLGVLPPLPDKIGIAIDAGPAPRLTDAPADFRIERSGDGSLILRADGRATGVALAFGEEADAVLALADWFAASGGVAAGRMARHDAALPPDLGGDVAPAPAAPCPGPGSHPLGVAVGLPFGRIDADLLDRLAGGAEAIRPTPWRMLLVEGGAVASPVPVAAALLAADACVGAPECPRATVETRRLAARLAPLVAGSLHVSGCAKGCARARPASVTLTGRDGGFDLGFDARAGEEIVAAGLSPAAALARFGAS